MGITEEVLRASRQHAADFDLKTLSTAPAPRLAVLACMDSRLTVEQILGLRIGEAHIIRNAGGIATEDALRSLIISHHVMGTQEFMVINHTDCGMLRFEDADLSRRLREQTGEPSATPAHFHAFKDLKSNLLQQVARIRSHPYLRNISTRGFIYDVKIGTLEEVIADAAHREQQSA